MWTTCRNCLYYRTSSTSLYDFRDIMWLTVKCKTRDANFVLALLSVCFQKGTRLRISSFLSGHWLRYYYVRLLRPNADSYSTLKSCLVGQSVSPSLVSFELNLHRQTGINMQSRHYSISISCPGILHFMDIHGPWMCNRPL